MAAFSSPIVATVVSTSGDFNPRRAWVVASPDRNLLRYCWRLARSVSSQSLRFMLCRSLLSRHMGMEARSDRGDQPLRQFKPETPPPASGPIQNRGDGGAAPRD